MTSSADLGLSPRERWGDYFSAKPADLTTRLLDAAESVSAILREAADAEAAARTSEAGLDIIKGIKAGKVYGTTPDGCIAEMSLSQADLSRITAGVVRTAEDERRDVLLKLDALAAEKAAHGFTVARRDAAASALRMAYEVIERGDHVGPTVESTRIASDAPTNPQEAGPRLPHFSEVRTPATTGRIVTYATGSGGVQHYVTDSDREALEAEVKRLRATRSAEDEQRDALSFLTAEAKRLSEADGGIGRAMAAVLTHVHHMLGRGDHVGAADR